MSDKSFYFKVLEAACKTVGIPKPIAEYRPVSARRWRIDFAWPKERIGLEIEGGIWIYGRHNRAKGFLQDIEKYNTLTSHGWIIYRIAAHRFCADILSVLHLVKKTLKQKESYERLVRDRSLKSAGA